MVLRRQGAVCLTQFCKDLKNLSGQFGQNMNAFSSNSVLLTAELQQGKEELRHNHSTAIASCMVFQVISELDTFKHI